MDKAAKKRVQAGIDRSRKAAAKARRIAAKSTGAKRDAYLSEAILYEDAVAHLLNTCRDLGVK